MQPSAPAPAQHWTGTLFQLFDKQFVNMQWFYERSADKLQVVLTEAPLDETHIQIDELKLEWLVGRVNFNSNKSGNVPISYEHNGDSYLLMLNDQINKKQPQSPPQPAPKAPSTIPPLLLPNLPPSLLPQNHQKQLINLQLQLNKMALSKTLFQQFVQLHKPHHSEKVRFCITKSGDDCHYIDLDTRQVKIDTRLDFDMNKFTKSLSWYDGGAWQVKFAKHDSMVELERVFVEILQKNRRVDQSNASASKFKTQYDGDPDSEQIYQKLFLDSPEFSSEIVNNDKLDCITVGKLVAMFTPEQLVGKRVREGQMVVSAGFGYSVVAKDMDFCVFTTKQGVVNKHHVVFAVSSKAGKKLIPKDMVITKDQRNMVFLDAAGSSTVYVYNVESSVMLQQYTLLIDKQPQSISHLQTPNGCIFYCLTPHAVAQLQLTSKGLALLQSRSYTWKLQNIFTAKELLVLGDQEGTARVYSSLDSKRSLNNLMAVPDALLHICVSDNQQMLLVTTRYKICMFVVEQSILKRLKQNQKTARQLHITLTDRQKYKIENYNFTKAKLILQDSYVVAYTYDLLIVWEVKKVLQNIESSYRILKMPEQILGFEEMYGQTKILVNLEYSLVVVNFG